MQPHRTFPPEAYMVDLHQPEAPPPAHDPTRIAGVAPMPEGPGTAISACSLRFQCPACPHSCSCSIDQCCRIQGAVDDERFDKVGMSRHAHMINDYHHNHHCQHKFKIRENLSGERCPRRLVWASTRCWISPHQWPNTERWCKRPLHRMHRALLCQGAWSSIVQFPAVVAIILLFWKKDRYHLNARISPLANRQLKCNMVFYPQLSQRKAHRWSKPLWPRHRDNHLCHWWRTSKGQQDRAQVVCLLQLMSDNGVPGCTFKVFLRFIMPVSPSTFQFNQLPIHIHVGLLWNHFLVTKNLKMLQTSVKCALMSLRRHSWHWHKLKKQVTLTTEVPGGGMAGNTKAMTL